MIDGSGANAAAIRRCHEAHGTVITFEDAQRTLADITFMPMLRKQQLAGRAEEGLTAAVQFYFLAA